MKAKELLLEDTEGQNSNPQPGQVVEPHATQSEPVAESAEPKPSEPESTPTEATAVAVIPEAEAEAELEDDDADEDDGTYNSFNWQASEFIHHEKKPVWFVLLYGVIGCLILGAGLLHQWFTIAVFVAMGGALAVYSNKTPRILNYSLTAAGINIDDKFYPYSQFRSFAVVNDVAWHSVDLEPTQRFMPRLSILFDSEDLDTIVDILTDELPRVDRKPDLIERITRTLRF